MDTNRLENALHILNSGCVAEALSELDALADLAADGQERGSVLLGQASCLMQLGFLAQARERWLQAVGSWKSLYADYIDLLLCQLENRREEAIPKLREFVSHRNELIKTGDENLWSDAAQRLGYLLFDSGQYSDAIQPLIDAAKTAETEDRKAAIKLYLGMCYIQVGDLSSAERILVESLTVNANYPQRPEVQYQLGRVYFRREAYAQARAVLNLCLNADGIDPDLAGNASELLVEVERRLQSEKGKIM